MQEVITTEADEFKSPRGSVDGFIHIDELAYQPDTSTQDIIESNRGSDSVLQRPVKRKKSKKKSKHIPNMRSNNVKAVLGANFLARLGGIQRDTQDAYKKAMLQEIPMADLVEMSTGEKLPDYQANLINKFHAQVDPNAPVVKRMTAESFASSTEETDLNAIISKPDNEAKYEEDDGPLTDEQIEAIRKASPATDLPESSFTQHLFQSTE